MPVTKSGCPPRPGGGNDGARFGEEINDGTTGGRAQDFLKPNEDPAIIEL